MEAHLQKNPSIANIFTYKKTQFYLSHVRNIAIVKNLTMQAI